MELRRKFGVMIVCGIPAIVGSGLVWALTQKWTAVYGYLFLLALTLLFFLFAPKRLRILSKSGNRDSGKTKGLAAKLRRHSGGN